MLILNSQCRKILIPPWCLIPMSQYYFVTTNLSSAEAGVHS